MLRMEWGEGWGKGWGVTFDIWGPARSDPARGQRTATSLLVYLGLLYFIWPSIALHDHFGKYRSALQQSLASC